MRSFLWPFLALAVLAHQARADDPLSYEVAKGGTITVSIALADDPQWASVADKAIVSPSKSKIVSRVATGDTVVVTVSIDVTGLAEGSTPIVIGTAAKPYWFVVKVLPAPVVPPPPPDTSVPLPVVSPAVPRKLPEVPIPSAAPPSKKVGAAPRPTLRPASPAMTASASTIRGTNVPRAAVPNSPGTATSATFPASSPATIRTNALMTELSGITTKAGANCPTATG